MLISNFCTPKIKEFPYLFVKDLNKFDFCLIEKFLHYYTGMEWELNEDFHSEDTVLFELFEYRKDSQLFKLYVKNNCYIVMEYDGYYHLPALYSSEKFNETFDARKNV